ncbi:hypothetical protein H1C71_022226, partial [Ictidomys tridecemlineatus]
PFPDPLYNSCTEFGVGEPWTVTQAPSEECWVTTRRNLSPAQAWLIKLLLLRAGRVPTPTPTSPPRSLVFIQQGWGGWFPPELEDSWWAESLVWQKIKASLESHTTVVAPWDPAFPAGLLGWVAVVGGSGQE